MAIQKIIKVGNSVAITLPKSFLEQNKIKVGDHVHLESALDTIMISTKSKNLAGITPEFVKSVDNFISKYRRALVELANK